MRLFDSQAHLPLIIALSGCANTEKSRPGTGKSVLARVNEEIASVETRGIPRPRTVAERARENIIYIFYFLRARRAKSKRSRRPCGSRAPAAGLRCVCSASDKYTHTHTNQLARAHTQGKMKVKPGVSRKGLYRQLFSKTRRRILSKQNPIVLGSVMISDDRNAHAALGKRCLLWSIFLNYTL